MRIILASKNQDKIREIEQILSDLPPKPLPHITSIQSLNTSTQKFEILNFTQLTQPFEICENGKSFQENALIKSKAIFSHLKSQNLLEKNDIILSDDSGICVDELGGKPGIYSARYSGGDDRDNLNKLLSEVSLLKNKSSKAHFCASIGLSTPFGDFSTHGFLYGRVIDTPRGQNGFGYDPMFIPNGFTQTLAELDTQTKNTLSHRKIALENAKYILKMLFNALKI